MYRELKGYTCAILRPSNPYGPGQNVARQQGAATIFLERVARGEPLTVWGDGKIVRDYVYVTDMAEAVVRAADWRRGCTIWNVSSERGTSPVDLIHIVERVTGRTSCVSSRPADGTSPRTF